MRRFSLVPFVLLAATLIAFGLLVLAVGQKAAAANPTCPPGDTYEPWQGNPCVQTKLPAHAKISSVGDAICDDGWIPVRAPGPNEYGSDPKTNYLVACITPAEASLRASASAAAQRSPVPSVGPGKSPTSGASPPPSGFQLPTCTLTVYTKTASGEDLDGATSNVSGGTRDSPLLVDPKGTIEWDATTGGKPISHASYHIEIFGVPTPLRGSMSGNASISEASNTIKVADLLPFDLVGTFYVTGEVDVNGWPYCRGSGWIKLRGDPVPTPGFVVGAALTLIGAANVLASANGRHPVKGAIAGLIGGAGLALLSGATSILPLNEATPLADVIAALILGLAIGAIDFRDLFAGGMPGKLQAVAESGGTATGTPPPPPPPPPVVVAPQPPDLTAATAAAKSVAAGTNTAVASAALAAAAAAAAAKKAAAGVGPGPKVGLAAIEDWKDNLPADQRAVVQPLFPQAQAILKSGPGTLTIGSDLVDQFLETAQKDNALKLSVKMTDGKLSLMSLVDVPVAAVNGKLAVTFPHDEVIRRVTDFLDIDVSSSLDRVKWFVDNINTAVAHAGQKVASVSVTKAGISITTAAATP